MENIKKRKNIKCTNPNNGTVGNNIKFNYSLNNLILSLIAGLSVQNYSEVIKDENKQCFYKKTPIGQIGFIKPDFILQQLRKLPYKGCKKATLKDITNVITFGIHASCNYPDGKVFGISLDIEIIKKIIYNQ